MTPDAESKTHFVLVDCVGVTEANLSDDPPLERKRYASFEALLKDVSFGVADEDTLSSLASRLARLDRQIGEPDRKAIAEASGGETLKEMVRDIIQALDPDAQIDAARAAHDLPADAMPTEAQIALAKQNMLLAQLDLWPQPRVASKADRNTKALRADD